MSGDICPRYIIEFVYIPPPARTPWWERTYKNRGTLSITYRLDKLYSCFNLRCARLSTA